MQEMLRRKTLRWSWSSHGSPGPRAAIPSSPLKTDASMPCRHARFASAVGARRFVRTSPTRTATTSVARVDAGLSVWACLEPGLDEQAVTSNRRIMQHLSDAARLVPRTAPRRRLALHPSPTIYGSIRGPPRLLRATGRGDQTLEEQDQPNTDHRDPGHSRDQLRRGGPGGQH